MGIAILKASEDYQKRLPTGDQDGVLRRKARDV